MTTAIARAARATDATSEIRRLSTLLDASQALSATLDLKSALHRVLEVLGRHHGAVRSTVVLLSEETGDLQVEASDGLIKPGTKARYAIGEGITGRAVQSARPIVVPRVSREPMFLSRAAERPERLAARLKWRMLHVLCALTEAADENARDVHKLVASCRVYW